MVELSSSESVESDKSIRWGVLDDSSLVMRSIMELVPEGIRGMVPAPLSGLRLKEGSDGIDLIPLAGDSRWTDLVDARGRGGRAGMLLALMSQVLKQTSPSYVARFHLTEEVDGAVGSELMNQWGKAPTVSMVGSGEHVRTQVCEILQQHRVVGHELDSQSIKDLEVHYKPVFIREVVVEDRAALDVTGLPSEVVLGLREFPLLKRRLKVVGNNRTTGDTLEAHQAFLAQVKAEFGDRAKVIPYGKSQKPHLMFPNDPEGACIVPIEVEPFNTRLDSSRIDFMRHLKGVAPFPEFLPDPWHALSEENLQITKNAFSLFDPREVPCEVLAHSANGLPFSSLRPFLFSLLPESIRSKLKHGSYLDLIEGQDLEFHAHLEREFSTEAPGVLQILSRLKSVSFAALNELVPLWKIESSQLPILYKILTGEATGDDVGVDFMVQFLQSLKKRFKHAGVMIWDVVSTSLDPASEQVVRALRESSTEDQPLVVCAIPDPSLEMGVGMDPLALKLKESVEGISSPEDLTGERFRAIRQWADVVGKHEDYEEALVCLLEVAGPYLGDGNSIKTLAKELSQFKKRGEITPMTLKHGIFLALLPGFLAQARRALEDVDLEASLIGVNIANYLQAYLLSSISGEGTGVDSPDLFSTYLLDYNDSILATLVDYHYVKKAGHTKFDDCLKRWFAIVGGRYLHEEGEDLKPRFVLAEAPVAQYASVKSLYAAGDYESILTIAEAIFSAESNVMYATRFMRSVATSQVEEGHSLEGHCVKGFAPVVLTELELGGEILRMAVMSAHRLSSKKKLEEGRMDTVYGLFDYYVLKHHRLSRLARVSHFLDRGKMEIDERANPNRAHFYYRQAREVLGNQPGYGLRRVEHYEADLLRYDVDRAWNYFADETNQGKAFSPDLLRIVFADFVSMVGIEKVLAQEQREDSEHQDAMRAWEYGATYFEALSKFVAMKHLMKDRAPEALGQVDFSEFSVALSRSTGLVQMPYSTIFPEDESALLEQACDEAILLWRALPQAKKFAFEYIREHLCSLLKHVEDETLKRCLKKWEALESELPTS